jgi:(2Fe-2S) ferredoxin
VRKRFTILVCRGPECGDKRDGNALYDAFEAALVPADEVELGRYSCFGRCRRGPNVLVRELMPNENPMMVSLMPTSGKSAVLYHGVTPAEAREVIEAHVRQGKKLEHLMTRGQLVAST